MTKWTIEFSETAKKQFSKIDPSTQSRIQKFIRERLSILNDPRKIGDSLKGNLATFWRYRVGNYRIIVDINDHHMIIQVIMIGHRKEVYE